MCIEPLSSAMETIINNQILNYLMENGLIPEQQYGFVPGKDAGTIACLKDAVGKWILNAEKGKYTVITSFDLTAAFPTLSTEIVMNKMKLLGIKQNTIDWFKDYLDYRILSTKVGDEISDKIKTHNQISEGSPISSTLFLIQVCDINEHLEYSTSNQFADDEVQSYSHKSLETALKHAELDANTTVQYFKNNKFSIQPSKTALLIIRPKRKYKNTSKCEIIVDGKKIKEKNNFKMLGMQIDQRLNFEDHCSKVISKSRRILAAIKRLSPYISVESATKILKSCLIGKVMYGGIFYLSKTKLRRQIEIIVMKAVRIITQTKLKDRIRNDNLRDSLKVTSIERLYKRQILHEMVKWEKKRDLFFQSVSSKTRGSTYNQLRPIGTKLNTKNSFLSNMQLLWNEYNHLINQKLNKKFKFQIRYII